MGLRRQCNAILKPGFKSGVFNTVSQRLFYIGKPAESFHPVPTMRPATETCLLSALLDPVHECCQSMSVLLGFFLRDFLYEGNQSNQTTGDKELSSFA